MVEEHADMWTVFPSAGGRRLSWAPEIMIRVKSVECSTFFAYGILLGFFPREGHFLDLFPCEGHFLILFPREGHFLDLFPREGHIFRFFPTGGSYFPNWGNQWNRHKIDVLRC